MSFRERAQRAWRSIQSAETLLSLWERVPTFVRRPINQILDHWLLVLLSLAATLVTAVLQYIAQVPPWITWFGVLGTLALVLVIIDRAQSIKVRRATAPSEEERRGSTGKARKERRRKALVDRVAKVLPAIPRNQKMVLYDLLDSPKRLKTYSDDVYPLSNQGLIESLYTVDHEKHVCVYEILPDVRPLVEQQLQLDNVESAEHLAETIDEVGLRALFLFTDKADWPQPLSDEMRDVNRAVARLTHTGFIGRAEAESTDREVYRFNAELVEIAEECLLDGTKIVRDQIEFDLNEVPASGASGAGSGPLGRG